MKLVCRFILLLGVLQWTLGESLIHNDTLTTEEQLVRCFEIEPNLLAGGINMQLKMINEQLLKDDVIGQSTGTLMQEFKKNMTHFQQITSYYMQLGLNITLASIFSDMLEDYYPKETTLHDHDFLSIKQLLQKVAYNATREKFRIVFRKFIYENFLPKLEDYNTKNPEALHDINFIKWIAKLKECETYECYIKAFKRGSSAPEDKFFGYMQHRLLDMTILDINEATPFAQRMLEDPRLAYLSSHTREILIGILKEYLMAVETVKEIGQIFFIPLVYQNITTFLTEKDDIPLKEIQSVKQILNDLGYVQLESNYKVRHENFLKDDLLKEFEHFRASLNQEELKRQKTLLATFDRLRNAKTFEQRTAIVNEVPKEEFVRVRF